MSEGEKKTPPIEGEVSEIKADQLFQITQPGEGGGKAVAFWNATEGMQANITLDITPLAGGEIEALDAVAAPTEGEQQGGAAGKFTLLLYPGEAKFAVRGKWKSMKKKYAFCVPDASWRDKQQDVLSGATAEEMAAVKKLADELGPAATLDDIARKCIATGTPFVDLTFPPTQSSISRPGDDKLQTYAWKRPSAYCRDKEPLLFEGEIEPNDIDQGSLGDCYFMCALACLSEFPELIRLAYAAPQCPSVGVYRCSLCKDGWWSTVVVDDFLPINMITGLPVFAKNREEPNELWVSLLEKTYAKLHGSYAAIRSGDPAMALADMVGGPYERLRNRPEWDDDEAMFNFLLKCDEEDHLMSISTPGVDTTSFQARTAEEKTAADELSQKYRAVGLCTGHAFSLIRVKKTSGGHKLCMIRNPWGNELEWNGDWSDDSPLWTPEIQKEVGFYKGDDGTFWMAWADVRKWFDAGSVTYRVGPLKGWSQLRVRASFEKGVPNVVLKIQVSGKDAVRCFIGAHQKDVRTIPAKSGADKKYLSVLIAVLQQSKRNPKFSEKVFTNGKGSYLTARDVVAEGMLPPSEDPYYVLVQGYQDVDRDFTLSAFFDNVEKVKVEFLKLEDKPETKTRFTPPLKFGPGCCDGNTAMEFQQMTPAAPTPLTKKGSVVDWLEAPPAPIPDPIPPAVVPKPVAAAAPAVEVIAQPAPKAKPSLEDVFMTGMLEKYSTGKGSGFFKNWKKRFFKLRYNGVLTYHDSSTSQDTLGAVELRREKIESTLIKKCTKVFHPEADENGNDFLLKTLERGSGNTWSMLLRAESAEVRNQWNEALEKVVHHIA